MNIHILGIAGTMTAPLAVALVKKGHHVTGSDQPHIYPPISTLLSSSPIELNQTPIDRRIDLAIIGSSYSSFPNCLREFDLIRQLNIPYISATQYLADNLVKENSILVAGSYGKTTITALVAWILKHHNFHPNFFFGGQLINDQISLEFSDSAWSVVEADESINGLDTKAKFLYYPVKYLILTSVDWEHKDTYSTPEANLDAYRQLVSRVPENGLIIYNGQDSEIAKIISQSHAKTIDYQTNQNFDTKLIGAHNQQNIAAAFTLCRHLGIDAKNIISAIKTFPGLKRRLEIIHHQSNILVIDDFAQSAVRVTSALEAVAYSYPHHPIYVYFEPHATFLQNKHSLSGFKSAFNPATKVILGRINYSAKINKTDRVTASDWKKEVGSKLIYQPVDQNIINYFQKTISPGNILVHFSSGGLSGIGNLHQITTSLSAK